MKTTFLDAAASVLTVAVGIMCLFVVGTILLMAFLPFWGGAL